MLLWRLLWYDGTMTNPTRHLVTKEPNSKQPSDSLIFEYLLIFVAVGVFTSCGAHGIYDLYGDDSPLRRLSVLNQEETTDGMVTLSGVVEGKPNSTLPPLCHISQGTGSGKSYRSIWYGDVSQEAKLVLPNGRHLLISTEHLDWESYGQGNNVSAERWRQELKLSAEGSVSASCLAPGDALFVDGCLKDNILQACEGSMLKLNPNVPNQATRRLSLLSESLGNLYIGGFITLVLLLVAWLSGISGAMVESLLPWQKTPETLSEKRVGLSVLLATFWLMVWVASWIFPGVERRIFDGQIGLLASVCFTALMLLLLKNRRRDFQAAARLVTESPTVQLANAHKDDQAVELRVEVKPNPKGLVGPLSQEPRAWWELSVSRIYRKDNADHTEFVLTEKSKEPILVEDASGQGLLSLEQADIDSRAVLGNFEIHSLTEEEEERLFLKGKKFTRSGRLSIQERYLAPGESLYVMGRVEELQPSVDGQGSYRESPTIPMMGGGKEKRLVIFAGSEEDLLADFVRERRLLWFIGAALLYTGAGLSYFLFQSVLRGP
jgi:hypothetical protein